MTMFGEEAVNRAGKRFSQNLPSQRTTMAG
jgi:hypothetical protein